MQMYISFDIDEVEEPVQKIEEAVVIIRDSMFNNFLCLNDNKTEVLLIASTSMHKKLNVAFITICNDKIPPAPYAKKKWLPF